MPKFVLYGGAISQFGSVSTCVLVRYLWQFDVRIFILWSAIVIQRLWSIKEMSPASNETELVLFGALLTELRGFVVDRVEKLFS